MRKFYLFLLLIISFTMAAQAPQKMNFQAIIRDASNNLVASQTVGMRISILQGSATGTAVYIETHAPQTNGNGLATLEIGGGNIVSGNFGSINWGAGVYFIKTETDPNGGTNYNITGTSQMLSVPYAMYAATSGGGNAGTPGENVGDLQYWNGSSWVNIPVGQPGQFLQLNNNSIPQWGGSRFAEVTTISVVADPTDIAHPICNAVITDDGLDNGGPEIGIPFEGVIDFGFCYSTNPNPTAADEHASWVQQSAANYSGKLEAVSGTTYYVRAYVLNAAGYSYGNQIVFNNLSNSIPVVHTNSIINVTSGTAVSNGGWLESNGGSPISAQGICYGTSPNPTTSNLTMSGLGVKQMIQLQMNSTYYVRAFATNSTGTGYGEQVTFTTSGELSIGASYQGGIIAYLFVPGDIGYVAGQTHGLIAAPSDQAQGSAPWGCAGTLVGGTSYAIGTGAANTVAIINGCATLGIAARLCSDLVLGGYSDWYLPSSSDLAAIRPNKNLIGGFVVGTGTEFYWSSSEQNLNNASAVPMTNIGANFGKTALFNVRAVRSF